MTIQRQFSGAVAWMAFGNWTEQAVNFLIFVILARLLGAEAFGLLAMAAVFVILSEFLVRETLSEALISLPEVRPAHLNSAFWLLAGFGGAVTLVLVFGAWGAGWFYDEPRIVPVMQGLALAVPMIALTAVPVAILRRDMRFRILSIRAIAGVIAGGIAGVALALAGAGVWALVGQRLVQVCVNIVLAWRAVDWRPERRFDRAAAREVGRFGGQVVLLRGGEIALTQMPMLVIGAVAGPVATGFYMLAWRLVDLSATLIAMPIRMAAQPAFAAIARRGEDAAGFLIRLVRLAGAAALPAFAGLAVLALPLLQTVFGQKWIDAAPILTAMAMIGAYTSIEKQHQAYALASGRAGGITAATWAEALLTGLALLLVLPMGLPAAALAQLAVLLALWPVRFLILGRIASRPARDFATPHLIPALGAVIVAATAWSASNAMAAQGPLLQLVTGAATGLVALAAFSLVFQRDRLSLARSFIARTAESPDDPAGADQETR